LTEKPRIVTTKDLKTSMAKRWGAPESVIVWEVPDATGSAKSRTVDALIMGLWQSRGMLLDGVEIKTQRSDWKRELKAPAKADAIARYCDRWWIHAAPGVVAPGELPAGWGLRVFDGVDWSTETEAALREPEPVSRMFLASLLRRSDQQIDRQTKAQAEEMLASERSAIDVRVEAEVKRRMGRAEGMASLADEFEKALGLDVAELIRNGEVALAARMTAALMRQDLHSTWGGLSYMIRSMRDLADRATDAMTEIGLEPPTAEPLQRARRSTKAAS
jgi:hypothetical protein